jgi:hypothetical protein
MRQRGFAAAGRAGDDVEGNSGMPPPRMSSSPRTPVGSWPAMWRLPLGVSFSISPASNSSYAPARDSAGGRKNGDRKIRLKRPLGISNQQSKARSLEALEEIEADPRPHRVKPPIAQIPAGCFKPGSEVWHLRESEQSAVKWLGRRRHAVAGRSMVVTGRAGAAEVPRPQDLLVQ